MNFSKELFDKTEAKEFGEFETLTLGGHEVVILDAREYESPISGNTSLKISIDIAGNDKQKDYFKKLYEENKETRKEWPNGGIRYLSLKDEQIGFLKGFITALENSNKNFKFNVNGNWEQLKGLHCAGVFGLEEYENQEGEIKTTTKLTQFRSLDKLSEIKVPKVKLISGSFVDYDSYKNNTSEKKEDNFIEISSDMLPF